MNRGWVLLFSIAIAALAHGTVFVLAPNIYLLRTNSGLQKISRTIRIDILQEPLETTFVEPETETLASRPGSVRDLLEREDEILEAPEPPPEVPVDVQRQIERAGSEVIQREHDLSQDQSVADTVDARILEISRDAARRDIEVARRLVRPSSNRVLEKGEFPTFRYAGADPGELVGLSNLVGGTGGLRGAQGIMQESGRPLFEAGILSPDMDDAGLPSLGIEDIMAQDPIRVAIREESRHQPLDDLVSFGLDSYVNASTGEGFFRLQIMPRKGEFIDVMPKEVTFLIDASKSIVQRKLDLSVRGLERCIEQLRPQDKFNIVIFRDTPSFFQAVPTKATDEIKAAAKEFISGLLSRGATDVYAAVRDVIVDAPVRGMSDIVIVISDGRPTSGALAGRDLINTLTAENVHRTTIYTFGGGRTVNKYLLDLLAYRNKGVSLVVPRIEDIDRELPRFFARVNDPILVGLDADYGQIDEKEIYPREIPDFYLGRAVTVYGRFDPKQDKQVVMRLVGTASGQEKDVVFKADLTAPSNGDPAIARNWAFQKSYHIIGEICERGERPDLLAELNGLSQAYGIKTSYTP